MNSDVTTHKYGFRVSRLCPARPRGYLDHAGVWKAREICRVRPYRPCRPCGGDRDWWL